jgi:hypothetical protein
MQHAFSHKTYETPNEVLETVSRKVPVIRWYLQFKKTICVIHRNPGQCRLFVPETSGDSVRQLHFVVQESQGVDLVRSS